MKKIIIAVCAVALLAGNLTANEPAATKNSQPTPTATKTAAPVPHCEVPCGIYADQMRFQMMLEDTATIAKAIGSISDFSTGLGETPPSAKDLNQFARWVTTKENHATNTQNIVAQYFLTQRIKADHKDYTGQLATAHRVMVAAMKCKQDADPATAEALKKAIYDLYRAYEGKEPAFENEK
jgi:nickel superoxide dismutase